MGFDVPDHPVRVRIAPSPTGDPHVGTAYVALFNKALARRTGGAFLLRIEDTDRKRFQADSERQILQTLAWLGLGHDEGPGIGGPHAPYYQSQRTELYREAIDELLATGNAYRCFCTPDELAAMRERQKQAGGVWQYDGTWRERDEADVQSQLDAGVPFVIRLKVPETGSTTFVDGVRGPIEIDHTQVDDQVLMKSDGFPTYHLANVVDDHAMGVTHVLRGEEWISSTPKHVLLYQAFGWDAPLFCHLPLLRENGKKIKKRKDTDKKGRPVVHEPGAANPAALLWYEEEAGILPEALVNFLGLMGYSMPDEREVFTVEEFYAEFDPSRLKSTGPDFDLQKLEWLNGEWIRRLSAEELAERIHGFFGDRYRGKDALTARLVPLVQPRLKRLTEWSTWVDSFYVGLSDYDAKLLTPKKVNLERAHLILDRLVTALGSHEVFTAPELEALCKVAAEASDLKLRPFLAVLRAALAGAPVSPPLFESMEILGRATCLERIALAKEKLAALGLPA